MDCFSYSKKILIHMSVIEKLECKNSFGKIY